MPVLCVAQDLEESFHHFSQLFFLTPCQTLPTSPPIVVLTNGWLRSACFPSLPSHSQEVPGKREEEAAVGFGSHEYNAQAGRKNCTHYL